MQLRPRGRRTGAILLTIGVLIAVVASLDLQRVRAELAHISHVAIAMAALIYLPSWVLRGQRWKSLAWDLGDSIPLRGATAAATVGNMLNLVLPAKAGDLLWAHAAHVRWSLPYPRALVGILGGRVLDLLVLAGVGTATLLVASPISPDIRGSVWTIGAAAVFSAVVLYEALIRRRLSRHFLVGSLARFRGTHDAFANAISTLCSHPPRAVLHVAVTGLIWSIEFLVAWYLAQSMGFALPWWAIIIWIFAANLSKIVPLTPASMGTYEAAGAIVLGLAGTAYNEAFALVLVEHLLKNGVNLILGLVFLAIEDLPVLRIDIDALRAIKRGDTSNPDSNDNTCQFPN